MPWSIFELYAKWPLFLLVMFRIAGLMLAAPFFSSAVLPTQLRVLLTMAIAAAVFPMLSLQLAGPVTIDAALSGLAGELIVGLVIGFSLALMFMAVQIAAEFISHQCGMTIGSVYNPMLENSESVFSQLYYMAATVGFFAVGGHRELIRAVLDSFATVPPLAFRLTDGMADLLLDLTTASFEMAIRISGPTIVALMIALLILGFLSRTMPQLNIINVGFPLKLGLALLMMGLTIMALEPVLLEVFATGIDGVRVTLGLPVRA